MKIQAFNKLALAFSLLAMPFMANAENSESQETDSNAPESHDAMTSLTGNGSKDLSWRSGHHRERGNRALRLSDFAGNWVFEGNTIGGLAGPTAIGTSTISIGQVHMGRDGNGTASFIAGSIYAGVPGHITTFQRVSNPTTPAAEINIVITDAENGIGTLTITSALPPPFSHLYDIIAIRSQKNGQVIKIISQQNNQNASSTESNVNFVMWQRQFQ